MSLPTFTQSSTAQEVASALKNEISRKNVLITGTSIKGIGFETARALAPYANLVVITGYNAERLKLSEDALKKEFPSANIRTLTLDLSSQASVRNAAAEVNAYSEPIHVLINNAANTGVYYLTKDNFEAQMATAQFATYLPRVVFVASAAHSQAPSGLDFSTLRQGDEPAIASTPAGIVKRYAETKIANILTAKELAKRAQGQLRAYSLHPGMIPTNGFDKEAIIPMMKQFGVLDSDGKPQENNFDKWKTLEQGAATTVAAAFDPRLDDNSGSYLVDSVVADEQAAEYAKDPATAEKLWKLTEEILGEKFEFS